MIKKFFLKRAEYIVKDNSGNSLLLKVNYIEGNVSAESLEMCGCGLRALENEVKKIGESLLKRKRKVNFAKKVARIRYS